MTLLPLALWFAALLPATQPAATDEGLAGLFPADRLAAVHVPSGIDVWESPLGLRLRAVLESQDAWAELDRMRGAVRAATGSDIADLARLLAGGELELGLYASRKARSRDKQVLAVSRTGDADGLGVAVDALLALFDADDTNTVERKRYGELPYARINKKAYVATSRDLLFVSSDFSLFTDAVDRALAGVGDALSAPSDALLEFSFDADILPRKELRSAAALPRKLLGRKLGNPLANLLLGGLTLGEGEVAGSLHNVGREVRLDARLPVVPEDAPTAYYPPPSDTPAGVPVSDQTIAVLFARRDLGDWWRRRETLMPEGAQPALNKTDETMGLLFSGMSPSEDVFGRLGADLALVVDRQVFPGDGPVPDVRLPAACLVATVDDPDAFAPTAQVAFQTLLGFINTDRAQELAAPFLLGTDSESGVNVHAARLIEGAGSGGKDEPLAVDFNFSPALAFVGDRALIGTSAEQVGRLVASLLERRTVAHDANLHVDVDVSRAAEALRDNRAGLIAQSILEDGNAPARAAQEVDGLIALIDQVERVAASLRPEADGLLLSLQLTLAETNP